MTKEYNRRGEGSKIKHPSVTVNGRATELGGRTFDQVEAWFDQPGTSPFEAIGLVFVSPGADKQH